MISKILSSAVLGVDAYIVEVEVDLAFGVPQFNTVGLPEGAVKESKERVRAAIKNCGYEFPAGRVTAVSGSATLRVGLLAAATAAGARCAVVGWPELGVAAVAEQGGRLDCLALVPDPGPDPAAVVSVLLDGLD